MATVKTLDEIRMSLEKHLGKTIILSADKGRKQIVTKKGVLEKVYPSVFVVKVENEPFGFLRVSYSYSDLLTSSVKLQVYKENNLSVG
ncbi:MAG: Veg family protein [Peptostreptococcaceae bacterium]